MASDGGGRLGGVGGGFWGVLQRETYPTSTPNQGKSKLKSTKVRGNLCKNLASHAVDKMIIFTAKQAPIPRPQVSPVSSPGASPWGSLWGNVPWGALRGSPEGGGIPWVTKPAFNYVRPCLKPVSDGDVGISGAFPPNRLGIPPGIPWGIPEGIPWGIPRGFPRETPRAGLSWGHLGPSLCHL